MKTQLLKLFSNAKKILFKGKKSLYHTMKIIYIVHTKEKSYYLARCKVEMGIKRIFVFIPGYISNFNTQK